MHGRVYVGARAWTASFESLIAHEVATFFQAFDAATDGFWMAQRDQTFLGSISVKAVDASWFRIRFFVTDPVEQGQGIGRALLNVALQHCAVGRKDIFLTTVRGLDAARHLYEQAGFRMTHEHEDSTWSEPMIEQRWELRYDKTQDAHA